MVEDLAMLLPRLFGGAACDTDLFFGNYVSDAAERMQFIFQAGRASGAACGPEGAML